MNGLQRAFKKFLILFFLFFYEPGEQEVEMGKAISWMGWLCCYSDEYDFSHVGLLSFNNCRGGKL